MAHADLDSGGRVVVHTAWNEKALISQVPGSHWDALNKVWVLNSAWASLVILRGVFKEQLTLSEKLIEWVWSLRRAWVDHAVELRDLLEYPADGTNDHLYPFQRAGVAFMSTAGSGILADEMGAGKSIQALTTIGQAGLPALIICPNSVKHHWKREAARWLPIARPYIVEGTPAVRRKTLKTALSDPLALVIINIESVRLFSRLAPYGSVRLKRCRECDPRWGTDGLTASRCEVHKKELNYFTFKNVILDEAHRVKEPKSLQTRATWYVGHQEGVQNRWALTGTPIANDPSDLWSIMHFVAPEDFPTRTKFVDRFCLISWNAFGGTDVVGIRPDTRDELFKLLDPRFRRMLKAVVLPQLPPKVRETRYADMTAQQSRMYKELEEGLVTKTDAGELLIAPSNLVAQIRLLQLSCASVSIEKPEDPNDVSSWKVTLKEPAPKLDVLEEVLAELGILTIGYAGPPVLIAAEFRQLIELAALRLTKLGVPHRLITGGVAEIDRERALDDLRARRIRALLFTSKAGGVGLDMSAANTLINLQRGWSLIDERQKEDRPHRPGAEQHERITIIDIMTRGTVEESVVKRLHEKLERLDELTRDRAKLRAANVHTDTSHLDAEEQRLLNSHLGVPIEETS